MLKRHIGPLAKGRALLDVKALFPIIGTCLALSVASSAATAQMATATETEIESPGPSGPFKGLLRNAHDASAPPIALIIPGSGPTDRDGNGPLVKSSAYRLLAEGLAEAGIASVRIDKRGLFSSAAAVRDANAVTLELYAGDVHGWIDTLQALTGQRCIWLIGHSEGALVSLVAADKSDGICGLVLLASPGRQAGDVLREQMRRFAKTDAVLDQALTAIATLEKGEKYDTASMHPALAPVFRTEIQDFMISLLAVDPPTRLGAYPGPALIVQGKRDLQVSVEDALRLHDAKPAAELLILPDTNHILKTVTTENVQENLATYRDPQLPLAPGIVEAIARFIHERAGSSDK